jgi:hypothetical protein
MLMEAYVAESVVLRVSKLISSKGPEACAVQKEMAMIYLHHAVSIIAGCGREAISAFATGDEQRLMLLGLKRFTKIEPYNLKEARRVVADYVIAKGEFPF